MTLRRRKNLDFKSSKGKSADFTEQNCWQVSLLKNSSLTEIPHEILTAEKEIESENLQKLCYEMDQMYIEQDFSFEAEAQDLILVGENDEDEMVTLEFIPESEEQKSPEMEERKLPEKPQIQSCITQFFKNNKNDLLDDRKKSSFLFF